MKLKAFSLMEVMVSILLSGIVVSAIYSGYYFTHKQFYRFTTIKTEIRNYFELSEVLNREFEMAKKITKNGYRKIQLELIDKTIDYSFNDDFILREVEQRTDTFFFSVTDLKVGLINELEQKSFVSFLEITINDNEKEKSLSLYKQYGAVAYLEK